MNSFVLNKIHQLCNKEFNPREATHRPKRDTESSICESFELTASKYSGRNQRLEFIKGKFG